MCERVREREIESVRERERERERERDAEAPRKFSCFGSERFSETGESRVVASAGKSPENFSHRPKKNEKGKTETFSVSFKVSVEVEDSSELPPKFFFA